MPYRQNIPEHLLERDLAPAQLLKVSICCFGCVCKWISDLSKRRFAPSATASNRPWKKLMVCGMGRNGRKLTAQESCVMEGREAEEEN